MSGEWVQLFLTPNVPFFLIFYISNPCWFKLCHSKRAIRFLCNPHRTDNFLFATLFSILHLCKCIWTYTFSGYIYTQSKLVTQIILGWQQCQCVNVQNTRTLELKQLTGIQSSFTLLFAPVLFLLCWYAKISLVKKACGEGRIKQLMLISWCKHDFKAQNRKQYSAKLERRRSVWWVGMEPKYFTAAALCCILQLMKLMLKAAVSVCW